MKLIIWTAFAALIRDLVKAYMPEIKREVKRWMAK
jgi:hypothetical protein